MSERPQDIIDERIRKIKSERPQSSVIERIRKILSKTTETGCTPEEAETAFAMASRILAEHNLSMDDIRLKGGDTEEKFTEEGVFETGRWTIEHNLAYHVVKNFCFVEGFFGGAVDGKKILYLFGTEANVATARHTFKSLLASAERLWSTYKILNRRPASEGRMYRTGVIKGFTDKLQEERQAQQMERDIINGSSGGTALAIRRIEDQTIAKYREAHPAHKPSKKGGRFTELQGEQSTLQAGYAAGKTLNLSRSVEDKTQKGIS